jgi:hypothetical protein
MALARVDDIVTYDYGSEATIIDGAGFAAQWSDPVKKQEWQDAIASDRQAPSKHAQNNMTEDFAESPLICTGRAKEHRARPRDASAIVLDTNTSTGLPGDG